MNRSIDLEGVAGALRDAGIRVKALRLLNTGRTLVVADGNRAIRIAEGDIWQAEQELDTAHLLDAAGAPVLIPLERRAYESVLGTATVWPLASKSPEPEKDLGRTLREFHHVHVTWARGRRDNRSKVRRIAMELETHGVDQDVIASLRELVDRLPDTPSWERDERVVVLHGDAHRGNVMRLSGRPVLIDTGWVQQGPYQLDLLPTWVSARRGRDAWSGWEELMRSYDPGGPAAGLWDWEHLEEAVLERELLMTLFLCRLWRRAEWTRSEVRKRLNGWDNHQEAWNTGRDVGA